MRRIAFALLPLCMIGVLHAAEPSARARQLAQDAIIVDTHIDAPENAIGDWNDLTGSVPKREFDYPRAKEGGLDVPWMSIFTSAEEDQAGKAWTIANLQIDFVRSLATRAPDKFALLLSPQDVEKNIGKIMLPMGMENGAPIGDDLSKVQFFFDRGIRYITLCHGEDNRIADSSYVDTAKWGGLSPFGEKVVAEMNRLGIIVDVSHISDDALRDVLRITDVPVIASHSGFRHFTPTWKRNLPDDLAKDIAKEGGVIQIAFGTVFLDAKQSKEWGEKRAQMGAMKKAGKSQAEIEAFDKQFAKDHPAPVLHVDTVLDHIDYAVKVVGIDHVGIGSDFDGVSGELPVDLKSVKDFPVLVDGLLKRGYSEADIRKILGGNMLRVWTAIEAKAEKH
ncbi:Zn-dependent dipeptidase [Lysobacter dokdonensis DS-58]|uniref:Zn-dependent dipeptidase n=1 Tax=Lysobacter dokdonensis DS-58 TaxID=1300345 RepID=A0A0A2WIG6_9GAMM|nr:dipeptidase [Lysobacter dokdonensis]KGQ19578.1 Zn-dependent dipeptidase [Lysobacter dokdonensis DS-58]